MPGKIDPRQIQVTGSPFGGKVNVSIGGKLIVTVSDDELRAGREVTLPDNSVLKLQRTTKYLLPDLVVLRDGQYLPGSSSDPRQKLKVAYRTIFLLAGSYFLTGIAFTITAPPRTVIPLLWNVAVVKAWLLGFAFLVMGFSVKRQSTTALKAFILLYGVDGLITLLLNFQNVGFLIVLNLLILLVFLTPLIQGIGAIEALRGQDTDATTK